MDRLTSARGALAAPAAALLIALLSARTARAELPRCPPQTDATIAAGWKAYRADSALAALGLFERADRMCPIDLDAKVGLGYANLRLGYVVRAESLFSRVAMLDPGNFDGWDGLMSAAYRLGDFVEALRAARRVWQLHPGNPDARLIMDRVYPGWDRPSRPGLRRPDSLVVPARAANGRFEVRDARGWNPLYVKGVNLGVTLPGRHPAEFPADSALYAGWLGSIADMNANAIRLQTLLPPDFYRALAGWNRAHPERVLWLIQGVWAEPPPHGDFDDATWLAELADDRRHAVGAVHGAAELIARPGHAAGRYDADVSRWTLAWVLGGEREPAAVMAYDAAHPGRHFQGGHYLAMADGSAMDGWLAARCDELADDEVRRFNALRPIAYENRPALDPLRHPAESDPAEEGAPRAGAGRPALGARPVSEHDAVSLDPDLVRATEANPAGWFACYDAYPDEPDFMALDPAIARARSAEGRSSYFGYLRELKRHHAERPLLIAAYGVPSSRGLTHLQPQGWTRGGLDEAAQAAIDARLTREIRTSGCAGGVLSAWMDDWSGHDPAVRDLEAPAERSCLWHNVMDPAQHFGVLAMDAGADGASPVLGGDAKRWAALPVLERARGAAAAPGAPVAIGVGADAAYVYLAIRLARGPGRAFDWTSLGVCLALDTFRADLGQRTLPGGLARGEVGFECVADFAGPGRAELRVTPDYNPYVGPREITAAGDRGRLHRFPIVTADRDDGALDSLLVIVDRARLDRDGTLRPARGVDRGRLRYGTEQQSTLSDWYFDRSAGLLEVRLAWQLLNVTDPSSRGVLWRDREQGAFGVAASDGFRVGVITYRRGPAPEPVGSLPALGPGRRWRAEDFPTWTWAGWETPEFHARLKPVYSALKQTWGSMSEDLATDGSAR